MVMKLQRPPFLEKGDGERERKTLSGKIGRAHV